jgi:AcrR family transcriptional regulator
LSNYKGRHKRKPASRERLEPDVRRAQILSIGLSMFSHRSYDDVSIDEIAQAAGISKGLTYHYFPTKRDLYVAALGSIAEELLERTVTPATMPPEERVRHSLQTYLDFVELHGATYGALISGGIGSDSQVAAILDNTRSTFVDRLVEDHPRELVTPILRLGLRGYIGFVEAAAMTWAAKRTKPVKREELVTFLTAVLFDVVGRGMAQRAPEPSPRRSRAGTARRDKQ